MEKFKKLKFLKYISYIPTEIKTTVVLKIFEFKTKQFFEKKQFVNLAKLVEAYFKISVNMDV